MDASSCSSDDTNGLLHRRVLAETHVGGCGQMTGSGMRYGWTHGRFRERMGQRMGGWLDREGKQANGQAHERFMDWWHHGRLGRTNGWNSDTEVLVKFQFDSVGLKNVAAVGITDHRMPCCPGRLSATDNCKYNVTLTTAATKTNSVALSPRANYTDWATAT
jgi:hypothetical protein